jgi:ABC-type protease/lipase transport system fused ATPase/permease subunit
MIPKPAKGRQTVRTLQFRRHIAFFMTAAFSAFINLLMLVSPLYMMQVYDRVLHSRSEATLLMLTL